MRFLPQTQALRELWSHSDGRLHPISPLSRPEIPLKVAFHPFHDPVPEECVSIEQDRQVLVVWDPPVARELQLLNFYLSLTRRSSTESKGPL